MKIVRPEDRQMQDLRADETTDKLVRMIAQTNLVALDKVLTCVRYGSAFCAKAARIQPIGERMIRALKEIRMTLPPEQRVGHDKQ